MIATVTVYSETQKYPIEFDSFGAAFVFYSALLKDPDIVKATLTTNIATGLVAQFDKRNEAEVIYSIIT